MPVTTPDTDSSSADRIQRRRQRAAERDNKTNADKIAPMTEVQMLNLPKGYQVGPLTFRLTCPTIGRAAQLQSEIYVEWPPVIVTAASADIGGSGIDTQIVAETMTIARENYYERALAEAKKKNVDTSDWEVPEAVTESEIAVILAKANLSLDEFLPGMCRIVWEMASGTPGFAYPKPEPPTDWEGEEWRPEPPAGTVWLDDAIRDHLRMPDLADLLRALLLAMSGFPGSAVDRFGPPSEANVAA